MAVCWIGAKEEQGEVKNGAVIAPGSWNVRRGPGTQYPSAGIVHGGDVLERVDTGDWVPIIYDGQLCFIGPRALKG